MPIEFAERIRRIPVYPAADGYALGGDVALLASNESPYPPIPAVVDAIGRVLGGLNRYPDPTNSALRSALSDRYSVPIHRIAIGNGSCDILLAAGEALLEPGAEVVYAWPSFSVYPHLAAASGARAIEVPVDAEHRHDLDAMLEEITAATRLVVVCNPNNPTSTALPLEEIAEFVRAVPRHIAVILDEAYCEFNLLQDPDDSLGLLSRHPNLVLLRTFSKVYGLCGLRVGFGLCGSEEFRVAVDQVRQPFFCNAAAQAAAIEALKHQDEVARRVERNLAERMELEDGLRRLGIEPAESQANFVWFDLPEGTDTQPTSSAGTRERETVRALADAGVLLRAGASLGREGALRVTVGTEAENARFVAALGPLLR
jgi:histidinol-phosphate aminotransferase